MIITTILACSPIAKIWNPLITGHCFNLFDQYVSTACINTASDIVILILPQVSIWKLQMALRKRLQISAIFFVGIL